jgi:hypothetical protein
MEHQAKRERVHTPGYENARRELKWLASRAAAMSVAANQMLWIEVSAAVETYENQNVRAVDSFAGAVT